MYTRNSDNRSISEEDKRLWNILRPLAAPTEERQGEATRVFQDAVAIAGDRLVRHSTYAHSLQASPLENTTAFLVHLWATRPTLKGGKTHGVDRVTLKNISIDPDVLGNLHRFALAIHDLLVALVVLNLYSQMPEGNSKPAVAARAPTTQIISRLNEEGFSWGPLLGFLGSGFRGILLGTRDNRMARCASVLGGLEVCAFFMRTEKVKLFEDVWIRSHSYLMDLIVKAHSGPVGQYADVRVDKIRLAHCLAYDLGYYWSVKVPSLPMTPLPKQYDGGAEIKHASIYAIEEELIEEVE